MSDNFYIPEGSFHYQIDDGVAIPPARSQPANKVRITMERLAVGQSFFIPFSDLNEFVSSPAARVRTMTSNLGATLGRRYTTRVLVENDVKGIRVFRER